MQLGKVQRVVPPTRKEQNTSCDHEQQEVEHIPLDDQETPTAYPNPAHARLGVGGTPTQSNEAKRKFFVVDLHKASLLSGKTDTGHMANRQDKHKGTGGDPHSPTVSANKSTAQDDVFALGVLFFEILFGINVQRGLAQEHGIESDFVAALLQRPRVVIEYREPLYDIDEVVIDLIGSMLDPDRSKRPSIRDCFHKLQGSTRQRGRVRKASKHYTRLRTAMFSRFSMESFYDKHNTKEKTGQHEGEEVRLSMESIVLPDPPEMIDSPLYPVFRSVQIAQNTVGFTTEKDSIQPFTKVQAMMTEPAKEEELLSTAIQLGNFSSMRLVVTKDPQVEGTVESWTKSVSPPKFSGTGPIQPKLSKKKVLHLGKKLTLKGNQICPQAAKVEFEEFLLHSENRVAGSGANPHAMQLPGSSPSRMLNATQVPQVCIIARETFKQENKPRKVILQNGRSSVCSSIFEIPNAQTPVTKKGGISSRLLPDTPNSSVSKMNCSLKLRIRGQQSNSTPKQSKERESPFFCEKPKIQVFAGSPPKRNAHGAFSHLD